MKNELKLATEPVEPINSACRDIYTQNYPQFLWIASGKPCAMPVSTKNTGRGMPFKARNRDKTSAFSHVSHKYTSASKMVACYTGRLFCLTSFMRPGGPSGCW